MFVFTGALDEVDTLVWFNDTPKRRSSCLSVVLAAQVSAKSKPLRGLSLQKRNDAAEAMKEDGRNEGYPGTTACGIPWDPHPSPKNSETERLLRRLPWNTKHGET